jgi:hypothetical protein
MLVTVCVTYCDIVMWQYCDEPPSTTQARQQLNNKLDNVNVADNSKKKHNSDENNEDKQEKEGEGDKGREGDEKGLSNASGVVQALLGELFFLFFVVFSDTN